jgi:hypothetical protein
MKRIEIRASGYGRNITITMCQIWGKSDRYYLATTQEARLMADQLNQAADAQDRGMRIFLASELASPDNET